MTDWAVEIDGLGKRYRLGVDRSRERIADLFIRRGVSRTEFWALRDVSFKVEKGESVGIIGPNGAGKSTLLKVLSRITAPTAGWMRVNGRVGTLLEVGTGFHPELSGRENVFLSGAILGLTRAQIKSKFDEILEFSEIGNFIDTPVKRYSSGMQVRLAFSVALYLEPEILIVDEVLAVGDLGFQHKSVGKLRSAASSDNRTVLFVSHSLEAVKRLCQRVIVLEAGKMAFDGSAKDGIEFYRSSVRSSESVDLEGLSDGLVEDEGAAHFTKVAALDARGGINWSFRSGETIRFRFEYELTRQVPSLAFLFRLLDKEAGGGTPQDIVTDIYEVLSHAALPAGFRGAVELELPRVQLLPGKFWLYLRLSDPNNPVSYAVAAEGLPNMSLECDVVRTRKGRSGLVAINYLFRNSPAPGSATPLLASS